MAAVPAHPFVDFFSPDPVTQDKLRTRLGETLRTDQKGAGTLQCLIGVSEKDEEDDEYKKEWNEFLLQGLRWLVRNGFIRSEDEKRVFEISDIEEPAKSEYSVDDALKGKRYVFKHKLGHKISDRRGHSVPKGQEIELYAITKYDMETMLEYVKQLGGLAPTTTKQTEKDGKCIYDEKEVIAERCEGWIRKDLDGGNGSRRYGVFCVKVTRDDGSTKESE